MESRSFRLSPKGREKMKMMKLSHALAMLVALLGFTSMASAFGLHESQGPPGPGIVISNHEAFGSAFHPVANLIGEEGLFVSALAFIDHGSPPGALAGIHLFDPTDVITASLPTEIITDQPGPIGAVASIDTQASGAEYLGSPGAVPPLIGLSNDHNQKSARASS